MPEKFCAYCRRHKDDEGGVYVTDPRHQTKRWRCSSCSRTRTLPRQVLEQRAQQDRELRSQEASRASREALERKRKNETNPGTE